MEVGTKVALNILFSNEGRVLTVLTKGKRTCIAAILLLFLVFFGVGCGSKSAEKGSVSGVSAEKEQPKTGEGDILVGISVPLTGSSAKGGQDMLNGAKMAEEELNQAGGILGKKIRLAVEDDAGDPQTSVAAANKLVSQGIIAVAGWYCSGAALASLPVYHEAGIPVILTGASATKLTQQGYKNVFRVLGHGEQQAQVAADAMVNKFNAKRIAILRDNTTYSTELAEKTKEEIGKISKSVEVQLEAIVPGEKDFTSVLTKVKSFGPDATYFTGYYGEGSLLVKQFKRLGIKGLFLAGDANNDPTFVEVAGNDAEGVIMTTPPMVEALPRAANYIKKYKEKFGFDPAAYSVYTYDGLMLLADAIKRAGTTESTTLIQALRETKDFPAITGKISFDEKGDLTRPGYVLVIVENGKFKPYE